MVTGGSGEDGQVGSDGQGGPDGRVWPGGRDEDRFGKDYADQRSAQELAADRVRVAWQVAGLGPSRRRVAFDREMERELLARRADSQDLLAVDLVRGRRGTTTPVVRGELLVRSDLRADGAVWAVLGRYGFEAEEVACLDGRLLRLRADGVPGERLDEIARFVRGHGHEASVNHIAPLAPFIKGQGGPEPTAPLPTFPPAFEAGLTTGRAVRVAVVDTGLTAEHRTDRWLDGVLTGPRDTDPLDAIPSADGTLDFGAGHGTFAAGIVQHVAPGAQVAVCRAMDSDGIGSEVDIACAIVRAADDGALVVNLSLGAETLDDQPLLAVEVALDILDERHPDVLVVAAAGNGGSRRPVFPAASPRVVAVAALDSAMVPAPWSTRGFWVTCSCVGQGVVSTFVAGAESPELDPEPDTWGADAWALWSGTSFCAPQVAGAVARLCGEDAALTPRAALQRLLAGARHVPDFGRVVRLLPGT